MESVFETFIPLGTQPDKLNSLLLGATTHFRSVIETLVNGVAFPDKKKDTKWDGKTYIVFSHEGDELGVLSTADICYVIYLMKKRGRAIGKLRWSSSCPGFPAFTLSWEGYLTFNGEML